MRRDGLVLFPFLYSVCILFFYSFSEWTFVNDNLDFWMMFIASLMFPIPLLLIFKSLLKKTLAYIAFVFFPLFFLFILREHTQVVYAKNGVIIKEASINYFLDANSVFYSFHQSKSISFLEHKTNYRIVSNFDYKAYEHKVILLSSGQLRVDYLDKHADYVWRCDTLDFSIGY